MTTTPNTQTAATIASLAAAEQQMAGTILEAARLISGIGTTTLPAALAELHGAAQTVKATLSAARADLYATVGNVLAELQAFTLGITSDLAAFVGTTATSRQATRGSTATNEPDKLSEPSSSDRQSDSIDLSAPLPGEAPGVSSGIAMPCPRCNQLVPALCPEDSPRLCDRCAAKTGTTTSCVQPTSVAPIPAETTSSEPANVEIIPTFEPSSTSAVGTEQPTASEPETADQTMARVLLSGENRRETDATPSTSGNGDTVITAAANAPVEPSGELFPTPQAPQDGNGAKGQGEQQQTAPRRRGGRGSSTRKTKQD